MTKNLTRTMIVAAALALSTAAVFAQTKLTANVPFAFTTMGAQMSAGSYEIVSGSTSNAGVLWIRNVATGTKTVLGIGIPNGLDDTRGAHLVFKCAGETCALAELWREDGRGYKFSMPRVKPSQLERVAVIYFERKNVD
jgi:hypothetical protein